MKHLNTVRLAMVFVFALLFLRSPLSAQEWSSDQQEVWTNVEAYWVLWAKRDLDGFIGYFHNDYSGWFNRTDLPSDKASSKKWIAENFSSNKIAVHTIQPVAIKVHGDFAIVHYYYSYRQEDASGKKTNMNGRWTDILMKDGDKWVLIGDHGGPSGS